ncbi:lysophospholipase [Dichomitus squalens]|uniref:Lysophospholipase n=1 Tax=Dichomitus squalens TaxID=114155 RepID=A0A4Q9MM31_9APHY|nr:lysophospholipase [Dichomitus squalens]
MTTPSGESTPSAVYNEAWLPGPSSTQFYTRTYPSSDSRAVLVFVHGFAEHVGRYEWAHAEYAKRGITVFTYDQRGFGRTALDKEKKSKESAYGKTSRVEQLRDIEWWVKHVKREFQGLPVFLMGHSMGGGLVLAFGTRTTAPPERETLSLLTGVIASSPLVHQTYPASKILRYIGGKASTVFPHLLIDAPVPVEDLSHDPLANLANVNDPWIIQKGSLKGLHDMLSGGEQLLAGDYKHWSRNLPLLVVHGDVDRVTSFKASKEFFDKVDAEDKTFTPFEGGFHELVHEPDGVKEKFVECCISWVLKHVETGSGPASKL